MAIFAPNTATECLYSTLRNLVDREVYYGFIPPHGKRLAAGEEITVPGDIMHHFARQTPNDRARRSFETALDEVNSDTQEITIVKSPSVHLYDDGYDTTKVLQVASGVLSSVDPCWGTYSSSAGEPHSPETPG